MLGQEYWKEMSIITDLICVLLQSEIDYYKKALFYFPSRMGHIFLILKSFLKVFILGMGLVDFPLCRRSLFRAFVKTDESGESPPIFGAETAHAWFSQVFRIDVTLRKIFSSRTFTSGEGTYWYTALKK